MHTRVTSYTPNPAVGLACVMHERLLDFGDVGGARVDATGRTSWVNVTLQPPQGWPVVCYRLRPDHAREFAAALTEVAAAAEGGNDA